MKMGRRSALCGAVALSVVATTAFGGPVTFVERAPYDQRAVDVEIDETALAGELEKPDLLDLIEAGRRLFDTKFTAADGAGRPLATQAVIPTHFKRPREKAFQRASGPDANSCTSCHNDPLDGGAGDFTANVFTSEGTESADFDNVDPQFSNERGTNHLFGSGLVELLAREMTADLHQLRSKAFRTARETGAPEKVALVSKGISFGTLTVDANGTMDLSGLEGVDDDLIIRPLSQKGVTPSLRMFTLNALNSHHGIEGDERFAMGMTGMADFDGDGIDEEFAPGLVSALVAYQATLEAPTPKAFDNAKWDEAARRGEAVFAEIGCAKCHVPSLPLKSLSFFDPGPYDSAGTMAAHDVDEPAIYDLALLDWAQKLKRDENGNVLVPLFGDLKRHVIADDKHPHFANELLSQGFVPRDSFMTGELWGIADTAPYGHRGDLTTLPEVIIAHGGAAAKASDAYLDLSEEAEADLLTYLMTLRMPE